MNMGWDPTFLPRPRRLSSSSFVVIALSSTFFPLPISVFYLSVYASLPSSLSSTSSSSLSSSSSSSGASYLWSTHETTLLDSRLPDFSDWFFLFPFFGVRLSVYHSREEVLPRTPSVRHVLPPKICNTRNNRNKIRERVFFFSPKRILLSKGTKTNRTEPNRTETKCAYQYGKQRKTQNAKRKRWRSPFPSSTSTSTPSSSSSSSPDIRYVTKRFYIQLFL
ncbi:hypothetical protein FRC20_007303 [Serendipita sp. 405]|nr:hypothetical protein FRC20_007303 [Serendipita sp. 405]